MLNAHDKTGVSWRPRANLDDALPYELDPGGNRPGPRAMWEEFDAAWERLNITVIGRDVVALALEFRQVWEALSVVADQLDGDEEWHAWERQAT